MTYNKGDRVRYTGIGEPGLSAPSAIGRLGTVDGFTGRLVDVKWDDPNASAHHNLSQLVYASNLELENTTVKFTALKKGERVAYTGKQPSLVGKKGYVENDKVAKNGTITVKFDGDDKAKVAKVSNLIRDNSTKDSPADKALLWPTATNPKDEAVIALGQALARRDEAQKAITVSLENLRTLGLDHTRVGELYKSKAVTLSRKVGDSVRVTINK